MNLMVYVHSVTVKIISCTTKILICWEFFSNLDAVFISVVLNCKKKNKKYLQKLHHAMWIKWPNFFRWRLKWHNTFPKYSNDIQHDDRIGAECLCKIDAWIQFEFICLHFIYLCWFFFLFNGLLLSRMLFSKLVW